MVEWNKNRNPRTFLPTDLFELETYDGAKGGTNPLLGNIIATGQVSNLRMTQPSTFTDIRIEPFHKQNGIQTGYLVDFKSVTPTDEGDQMYIEFPKTIEKPKEPVCQAVEQTPI